MHNVTLLHDLHRLLLLSECLVTYPLAKLRGLAYAVSIARISVPAQYLNGRGLRRKDSAMWSCGKKNGSADHVEKHPHGCKPIRDKNRLGEGRAPVSREILL